MTIDTEKQADPGYILKLDPKGLANGLAMGAKGREQLRKNSMCQA